MRALLGESVFVLLCFGLVENGSVLMLLLSSLSIRLFPPVMFGRFRIACCYRCTSSEGEFLTVTKSAV